MILLSLLALALSILFCFLHFASLTFRDLRAPKPSKMDQSPTSYTSVPLYDAEEELSLEMSPEYSHDADKLSDYQDPKEEEEAALLNPALPSRTTRRLWLFLLCGLITTLALASTCFVHSTLNAVSARLFKPQNLANTWLKQGKIYSIAVNRTAAVSELVHAFKVAGGGSLSMYRTRYNAGPESKEEIIHTCNFESVCVQRRILEDGKKENEYWLIGTNDKQTNDLAKLDPVAADAFQHCVGTPTSPGSGHPLGIKRIANSDGEIHWMSGSTLAFVNPAPALTGFGAHTEWLQSWARFMSLIITLPDFMSDFWDTKGQFFRHVIVNSSFHTYLSKGRKPLH